MAEGKANGELRYQRLAVLAPLVEHISIGIVTRDADDAALGTIRILEGQLIWCFACA